MMLTQRTIYDFHSDEYVSIIYFKCRPPSVKIVNLGDNHLPIEFACKWKEISISLLFNRHLRIAGVSYESK